MNQSNRLTQLTRWLMTAVLLTGFGAQAQVNEQSEHHFVIKHQFVSQTKLEKLYHQFAHVQWWWEASHSLSGDAENLYFSFGKDKCFCEKMKGRGFVEHLKVIHYQPEKRIVFSGGLGPLQDQPVNGRLIFTFDETDKGVLVKLEYRVAGTIIGGMKTWPAAVDRVLGAQLKNLEKLVNKS